MEVESVMERERTMQPLEERLLLTLRRAREEEKRQRGSQ
jgi:hypothetical protein